MLRLFLKKKEKPYFKTEYLLTPPEKVLFSILKNILPEYEVFVKVRLADIVKIKKQRSYKQYLRYFNRIACKHVDYLICSKDSLRLLLVIELDDSTHDTQKRQKRDSLVEDILKDAGIPIVRFRVSGRWDVKKIKSEIFAKLGKP